MKNVLFIVLLFVMSQSAFSGSHENLIGNWTIDMEKLKKSPDFHIHKNDPNEGMKKMMLQMVTNMKMAFTKNTATMIFTDGKGSYMSQKATYKIVKSKRKALQLKMKSEDNSEKLTSIKFVDADNIILLEEGEPPLYFKKASTLNLKKAVEIPQEKSKWYNRYIDRNMEVKKIGTIKPGQKIKFSMDAKSKKHIGFKTNVFHDDIDISGSLRLGNDHIGCASDKGAGLEFNPHGGVIKLELANNANKSVKYVIYEWQENK